MGGLKNCRSLGFARDDKGEGGASIGCGGTNDNRTAKVMKNTFCLQSLSYGCKARSAGRETIDRGQLLG
jgi:hypothetical protein